MDILAKLRIIFWGLVIALWGLFMYQYMNKDMSGLRQFRIKDNPFTGKPSKPPAAKRYIPGPGTEVPQPAGAGAIIKPAKAPLSSMSLIKPWSAIKDIPSEPVMPERSSGGKTAAAASTDESYPAAPQGFAMKVTRNFVIYEEGTEVSAELSDTVEALHGSMMLDLVSFSPWTRDKKVFIFFSNSQDTYRRLTGRPAWSGGTASSSGREIYLYKSDEAFGILAHELTHIYFDGFFPASHPSPLWLSEGLATYIQSERGYSTPDWLAQNLKALEGGSGFKLNDLVRIDSLEGADEDSVRLWYAESYSVVRFLLKLKQGESFYIFCKGLRENKPTPQALYQAYGMPYNKLSSLEYAWRYDLKTGKISGVNK